MRKQQDSSFLIPCPPLNLLLLFPYIYLQDAELNPESRDLISSLPREKGWVANHLHQYQGFWHTTRQMQGVLACRKHFQAQDAAILVSTLKSGTTWLKAILFALVKRVHYHPDPQQHPLLTNNPHVFGPSWSLICTLRKRFLTSPPILLLGSFQLIYRLCLCQNLLNDSACKVIYLCRDPKDTFVSLWHFTNKEEAREVVDNISRLCSFENLSNLDVNKSGNCYGAWSIEHYFGESELDCVTEQKLQGSGLKF
ncbi:hypothetical protein M0R45_022076 [Rubus argutus]|uniref:Sulfotransferase n=1 Tax=Rubus argutus TaxID=59490 RepID=A0AAW1XFD7_RUBAR